MIKIPILVIGFLLIFIISVSLTFVIVSGQENIVREEEFFPIGPFYFNKELDVGIIIAAFAFILAFAYNGHQTRMSERHFREQMKKNRQQLHMNEKINDAQILFSFEQFFTNYEDIENFLRPGSKWDTFRYPDGGPKNGSEWTRVEAYMGIFEHVNRMIDMQIIDLETFKEIFGYRVVNILNNRIIVQTKLIDEGNGWQGFIQLCHKLEIQDLLPPPLDSIIIKSKKEELSITFELEDNLFKGRAYPLIIRVSDGSIDYDMTDIKVEGRIMNSDGVIYKILETTPTNSQGEVTYFLNLDVARKYVLHISASKGYAKKSLVKKELEVHAN